MKPKKISLKEIQGVLSQAEMKKIKAGCGGCNGYCFCSTSYTDSGGYYHGSTGLCGSQDKDACQGYAVDDCRSEAYAAGGSCTLLDLLLTYIRRRLSALIDYPDTPIFQCITISERKNPKVGNQIL